MLPSKVKAEVKLTTGSGVSLAVRELEAIAVADARAVGLVAVLFVGGDRDQDGRWVMVDAGGFRRATGDTVSAVRTSLVAMARTQPWLDPLRRHVDELWPAFLGAYGDVLARGHAQLVTELDALHRTGRLGERVARQEVTAFEHRSAVKKLVEDQGESDAGRLAQDLLAYLIALAGYRKVTLNPVGVPDFVLEDCANGEDGGKVTLTLSRADAERVAKACRDAGQERLAQEIEELTQS